LGKTGATAALSLRALQMHVIASVLLERSIERYPTAQPAVEAEAIALDVADAELADALAHDWDRVDVFEFGLQALLAAL
jgi:hypothetical protein